MFQLICTALLISFDGFLSGLCFGIKKIKISWSKLLVMSSISFFICLFIMLFADSLFLILDEGSINKLTFSLFFILFVASFKNALTSKEKKDPGLISILNHPDSSDLDHNQVISIFEAFLLGCALSLDNSVLCLHYSLCGFSYLWTPLCFSLTNLFLVKIGNMLIYIPKLELLKSITPFIPSILFLIFALIRIPVFM